VLTSSHIFIPTGAPGAPYGLPGDPSAGSLSGHPGQNGPPAAAKELTLVYNDELESMVRLHERYMSAEHVIRLLEQHTASQLVHLACRRKRLYSWWQC
jgi:hypothetical protein